MDNRLDWCSRCGARARLLEREGLWFVRCSACEARSLPRPTPCDAIMAWNMFHVLPTRPAEPDVYCPACGEISVRTATETGSVIQCEHCGAKFTLEFVEVDNA
jgi:NADH pyrophosphatase NudC (nudix superfamily)